MLKIQSRKIYLACGATDMRKSINALAITVKHSFHLDPFSSALFVFCNQSRNCLKMLEWDGDGFWLYYKRLEGGHFLWPSSGEDATMLLSREELLYLLENTKLTKKIRRTEVRERIVA